MLTRTLKSFGAFAVALLALALVSVPAQAQVLEGEVEQVPSEELREFAEIYLDVDEIRQEVEMEIATAESPEEAQQIQQQANVRMTAVVEEHGMSIERYTEITQALNTDPQQHQEFVSILEEIEDSAFH